MTFKNECTVEEYPLGFMLFRTVTMAAVFVFGGYILYSVNKWFIIPFGVACTLLFILILKYVCSRCRYMGKRCDLGLGKLASLLFKSDGFSPRLYAVPAKKSIPWIFLVLALPVLAGVIILITKFSIVMLLKVSGYLVLVCFFILSGQLMACPRCKMNRVCPACIFKHTK